MSKQVMCGDVPIGGDAPISIQSMTNTDTRDIKATVEQIKRLQEAGCQIVRLAIPDREAAEALQAIKKETSIPLVADIHFDYQLALDAMKAGADKIRINPGNIGDLEGIKKIVAVAKERSIPIRVGVNSGSLEKDILEKCGGPTAEALAESAMRNVRLLEELDFFDIVLSLKSSDVKINDQAYRLAAAQTEHPLHIGITEAGTPTKGKIKSAAGLGALLLSGIGDTLRVSLTADPVEEVLFAKELLGVLGIRKESINLISCPTCGRTAVNLQRITKTIEQALPPIEKQRTKEGKSGLTVAVMGCVVNGPGEAREAHLGVACGQGKGSIFSHGQVIKTVEEEQIPREILQMIKTYEETD